MFWRLSHSKKVKLLYSIEPNAFVMQTNIVWTGIADHSLESCNLIITDNGADISSFVSGRHDTCHYEVTYRLKTNRLWETLSLTVQSQLNGAAMFTDLESDGKGNWLLNGERNESFTGCIDVDISVTAFTNSLPINRLRLREQASAEIRVLYIDILEQRILPVYQKYTKLSKNKYKYENVPNDFEALISVDEAGLVTDYPELFKRVNIGKTQ